MSEQRTDAWLAERAGKATASRVADLTAKVKNGWGASRANMIAQLVAERLSGQCLDTYQSAAMQRGIELEDDAIAAYEFAEGHSVERVGFIPHPELEWAGASPDGLVGDDGLVEVKCPNLSTHIATLRGAKIPAGYVKQMQWQMRCTDRQWCDFASYDDRLPVRLQLHVQRVHRDDELIANLEADVESALAEVETIITELVGTEPEKAKEDT